MCDTDSVLALDPALSFKGEYLDFILCALGANPVEKL